MKMYKTTDKYIEYMRKRFIKLFAEYKATTKFDELNVINSTKELYKKLDKVTRDCLLAIAMSSFKTHKGNSSGITDEWLDLLLNDYDEVALYVYTHEIERKQARLIESVIASNNKAKEVDKAMRYFSQMATWYAIQVTDKAYLQAYKDRGVKKVKWVTIEDEKRCKECAKRDSKVYKIDNIPPKPHLNCRCYLVPYD